MSFFKRINKKIKFEIIFLDPPFAENFFIQDLKTLKDSKIYTKNHIVIIHREKKSKDDLKDIIDVVLTKTYGRSRIIFGNFNSNIS
jgi:16S rRNA G966 N2-methylase RsmD